MSARVSHACLNQHKPGIPGADLPAQCHPLAFVPLFMVRRRSAGIACRWLESPPLAATLNQTPASVVINVRGSEAVLAVISSGG